MNVVAKNLVLTNNLWIMKKIILTLSGVLFVIVTGCSLLICMMNGIPKYVIKGGLFKAEIFILKYPVNNVPAVISSPMPKPLKF